MKKLSKVKKKYLIIIAFAIGLIILCSNLLPTNMRYFADVNLIVTGYAKETRKGQYEIIFHSNGKDGDTPTGEMQNETMNYTDNKNLTKNAFTSSDYRFVSWNTEANGTGESFADEQEITPPSSYVPGNELHLYAQWKEKLLVTFDGNGGTIPASLEGYWTGSGDTASKRIDGTTYGEMPRPTRADYTFLGWRQCNLPDEYQEVEYIEFNTGNFIDTGLIPSNHTTEIKFDYETYTNDEFLLGTSQGSSYYYTASYNNKYVFGHDGNKSYTSYGTWTTGDHHLIYNGENNSIILDGETLETGYGISSTANLWLGKRSSTANFAGKIYYVKITDKSTGEMARNMIPCYKKSDGTTGMYDTANGKFYTNAGTGSFEHGEDIDYITSTTQVETNENHTLYAIWRHNPTVTFNANGGTVPASSDWNGSGNTATKQYLYNSKYTDLPTPTREGYTFIGWSNNEVNNNLPSEYQEVEYIESTGTQYIETKVVATNSTGIYAKLSSSDISSDSIYIGSNSPYYFFGNNNSKVYYAWSSILSTSSRPQAVLNEVNEFELNYMNSKKFTYKDTTFNISGNLNSGTRKLMIFAGNYGNASYKSKIKLYRLKISESKNIINDFIPCYRKSDNVIGLYDLVSGEFYTDVSNSSTPFEKGKDISYITEDTIVTETLDHTLYAVWRHNPVVTFNANGGTVIPSTKVYNYNSNYGILPTPTREGYSFKGWKAQAYQEVEYIEATGNQYILTNIIPSVNYKVVADIYKSSSNTSEAGFMGAKDSSTNKGIEYYFTGSSLKFWVNNGSNSYSLDAGNFYNQIVHYEASNKSTGMELLINGSVTRTNTFSYGTGKNVTPFTIFAYNDKGNPRNFYNGRIYSLKIYNENTLISDLKPCYRMSDNEIGMYDVVNGAFYTNQGAGTFSKGNDLNSLIFDTDVTSTTQMITNEDHTLYAVWEENE